MNKYKYWTGIGSRKVTPEISQLQVSIGERMAKLGYILLSGGAEGSDTNFHKGVCNVDPTLADIYIPWNGFCKKIEGSDYIIPHNAEFEIARKYYLDTGIIPWYDNMKQGAQKLHGRNYYQIFGDSLMSSVVIYAATENDKGEVKGGTRSAVMIARNEGIPTRNIMIPEQRNNLLRLLDKKEARL